MSNLKWAREQLDLEVECYGHGTANQPKEKTQEWFMLRARSVGRTLLRRMEQLSLEGNPAEAERLYKSVLKAIKADEPS